MKEQKHFIRDWLKGLDITKVEWEFGSDLLCSRHTNQKFVDRTERNDPWTKRGHFPPAFSLTVKVSSIYGMTKSYTLSNGSISKKTIVLHQNMLDIPTIPTRLCSSYPP